jgi:hypothetical protein
LIIVAFGPFARELEDTEKQDASRIKVMDAIFLRQVDRPRDEGLPNAITDDQINLIGKVVDMFTRGR